MTHSLPAHPSLENLRKQAKSLKRAWAAGDSTAIHRVSSILRTESHPELEAEPRLSTCQFVIAREVGFTSWAQLKVAVLAARHDLPDQFLWLACLCFDDPHYDHRMFHQQATDLLRKHPWIASANLWAASAAGNVMAVHSILDAQPNLVNQPGPHGWPPLMCACYARATPLEASHSTLAVARMLLDRGADANAFTLKRNADERLDQTARRFTLLTGIFGGGSTGNINEPMHPQAAELARILLEHGADPADEEAILHNPDACLPVLLEYGLQPDAPAKRQIGGGAGSATLMGRALNMAAMRGATERVRLLLEHGARTEEVFEGRTPWEHAMARGNLEIARMLEDAGASQSPMTDAQRFVALCLTGDQEARAMLESDPGLRAQAPANFVQQAVATRRRGALRLVLDLGFDPNAVEDNSAIHMAGDFAADYELLRILLAAGGSLHLRDPWYDGTGIGWADFMGCIDLRDHMLGEDNIDLFDALDYGRLDRVGEIVAQDPAALERTFAECLTREPKPEDGQTPLVRMVERGRTDAVRVLLEHGASVRARHPDGRSLIELARDGKQAEIEALLLAHTAGL
jgi:ankyrin repeat protein